MFDACISNKKARKLINSWNSFQLVCLSFCHHHLSMVHFARSWQGTRGHSCQHKWQRNAVQYPPALAANVNRHQQNQSSLDLQPCPKLSTVSTVAIILTSTHLANLTLGRSTNLQNKSPAQMDADKQIHHPIRNPRQYLTFDCASISPRLCLARTPTPTPRTPQIVGIKEYPNECKIGPCTI